MISNKILNTFKGKRILVTGGTGLIGRQVVDILVKADGQITIVSLDKLVVNKNAKHLLGDLTDFEFCKKITKNKDFVFHLAGIKGSIEVTKSKPASFFVPILMMNTNILEASRSNGVKKLVYTSSIGAYSPAEVFVENRNTDGEPMDMFPGWAKRMAEKQIEAYKIQYGMTNFAIVRPCNVYGPGDNFDPKNAMVIPSLMSRIHNKENPVTIWGDGSAIRDFLYSRDAAEGVILALYYGTKGSFVNLGSGKGCSIRELIEMLNSFINFRYKFDKSKPSGYAKRVMNMALAKSTIMFSSSTSLLEGLKETWSWFLKNQYEYKKKRII